MSAMTVSLVPARRLYLGLTSVISTLPSVKICL
jgi:hypothetical protein